MKQLADRRVEVEGMIEERERKLTAVTGLQREHLALAERLTRAQDAAGELPRAEAMLADAEAVLDRAEYAPQARAALARVTEELAALGYDAAAHNALRQALAEPAGFADRKAQLDRASVAVESEERALAGLAAQEQALAERRAAEEGACAELKTEIQSHDLALQREPEISAALQRARNEFFSAQRRAVQANQQVQSCLALEGTRERLRANWGSWRASNRCSRNCAGIRQERRAGRW